MKLSFDGVSSDVCELVDHLISVANSCNVRCL